MPANDKKKSVTVPKKTSSTVVTPSKKKTVTVPKKTSSTVVTPSKKKTVTVPKKTPMSDAELAEFKERFRIWKELNTCNAVKCKEEQKAVNDSKYKVVITNKKDMDKFMQTKEVLSRNACLIQKCPKKVDAEINYLTSKCDIKKPTCQKLKTLGTSLQKEQNIDNKSKVYSKFEVTSLEYALQKIKDKIRK